MNLAEPDFFFSTPEGDYLCSTDPYTPTWYYRPSEGVWKKISPPAYVYLAAMSKKQEVTIAYYTHGIDALCNKTARIL